MFEKRFSPEHNSEIHEARQLRLDPVRGYHDRNVCRVVQKIDISGKDGRGGSLFVDAAYRLIGICSALVTRGLARMGCPARSGNGYPCGRFTGSSGFTGG